MTHLKRVSPVLRFMGRNLLAFVTSVIVLGAGVYAPRLVGRSVPFELVTLLSCLIATAIALRLRARPVAFLVVGLGAWRLSMFFVRTVYGGQWAQTEAQFAAMIAGVVGAIFGAALVRWAGPTENWLVSATSNSTSPVRRRGQKSNTERPSQPHTLQGVVG